MKNVHNLLKFINCSLQVVRLHWFLLGVTCIDEASNSYFEGAKWTVDSCTSCECRNTAIRCIKKISQVQDIDGSSTEEKRHFVKDCQQPNCNIAQFTSKNYGNCQGIY